MQNAFNKTIDEKCNREDLIEQIVQTDKNIVCLVQKHDPVRVQDLKHFSDTGLREHLEMLNKFLHHLRDVPIH